MGVLVAHVLFASSGGGVNFRGKAAVMISVRFHLALGITAWFAGMECYAVLNKYVFSWLPETLLLYSCMYLLSG